MIRTIAGKPRFASLLCRTTFQVVVVVTMIPASFAQSPDNEAPQKNESGLSTSSLSSLPSAPEAQSAQLPSGGMQPERILGIIPNYRAVSADTELPALSFRGKLKLATQDSFDYSSFLVAGFMAGTSQAKNSTPEFRQGSRAYGRYFWRTFTDQAVGNYFTEAIVPYVTHEDPSYYTRYHGGFIKRTCCAVSRLFVTRTDSGGETFNFLEIIGNGAAAGISDLYYPRQERTWTKTGQKWATQVALDGIFNVMKEFWPDIRQHVFHK